MMVLTVLQMELDGRAVGDFCQPQVKIFAFPCFGKQTIVAIVQLGKFVELVQLRLGIELDLFTTVREHRRKVIQEVPMPVAKKWLGIESIRASSVE